MYSKVKLTYWVDVFNTEISDFDTISVEKEHDLIFLIKSSKSMQEFLLEDDFENLNIPKHCTEVGRGINIENFIIDKTFDDYEFLKEFVFNLAIENLKDNSTKMISIINGLVSQIKHMEDDITDDNEDLDDD